VKVLHVNTYLEGGAAIAARRLHDSLVAQGIDSSFCFAAGAPPDKTYFPYFKGPSVVAWRALSSARTRLRMAPYRWRRPEGSGDFSDSAWMMPLTADALPSRPDIVHLHWTANLLNYETLFASLPARVPLVWTLHDMHPFTGGCHYSGTCEKFASSCGECPQLNGRRSASDPTAQNFSRKRAALRDRNLHIAADSRWLETQARRSTVFAAARSFQTIHYGLDTEAYAPMPKRECRQALGFADDAFVVCFGAPALSDPRKGLRELLEALRRLRDLPGLMCLFFGADLPAFNAHDLPPIRSAGFLSTPAQQAQAYSAADVFVIPSLAEAFGQTALEAMACGTPVVGFDTGGIPDIVRPQVTGLLAPVGDAAALAEALRWSFDHRVECAAMGGNARRMVEVDFTLQRQADAYLKLYRSL